MKKLLSTLAAVLCAVFGFTQVKVGDIAPDFNLPDINGKAQHLYSFLDSGYAVIIDVSAAWCGPCWEAHQSQVFEKLTTHYGPGGSIAPGKVKVLFIEGEPTNTTAQLYGTYVNSTHAGSTAGSWVAGTNYPIIDNSSLNNTYLYSGYPSFTVICRDRLVMDVEAGWNPALKDSESYWVNIVNRQCPAYAPSATIDAKAAPYNGSNYFVCTAAPSLHFQNYSQTSTITAATIKVYSGSTVIATVPWSGSLPPYGVATVPIPSFNGTGLPYKFDVTVAGDTRPANNMSPDSVFKVYAAPNALSIPWVENLEARPNDDIPYRMTASPDENIFFASRYGSTGLVDKYGKPTRAVDLHLSFLAKGASTSLLLGNFNTAAAPDVVFEFDYTYGQNIAADDEKLVIQVSLNCGVTWINAWTKSGAALATVSPSGSKYSLFPYADTVWKHGSVALTPYKSQNMLVRVVGTSNPGKDDWGHDIWLDNFRLSNGLGTAPVADDNSLSVYPNPAREQAYLDINLKGKTGVAISVTDVTGRTVANIPVGDPAAVQQHLSIPTAALTPGVYQVVIRTPDGVLSRRLVVMR